MPRKPRALPRPASGLLSRAWRWTGARPWWLRWCLRLGGAAALLAFGAFLVTSLVYGSLARGYDMKKLGTMPERSVVYDARGEVMGRLHGENRVVVPLADVSPHFIQALLAREDDRFYSHGGVDWRGLARALARDLKDRSFTQGASTITMQLARNSFSLGGKSLHRKLLEMAVARRIESSYSKDEILALYVNRIFFGTGLYGVERASQAYFGKPAKDLTLDEGAMLAAIIRGPNKFSPFRAYDVAVSGRDMVLDRMVARGRITPQQADAAKTVQTKVGGAPQFTTEDDYALDAVRRDLLRLLDAEDEEDGGLHIHTTIDLELQRAAEHSLEQRLAAVEKTKGYPHPTRAQWQKSGAKGAPTYLQGAVVVLDNPTGAMLAIVGGRDFKESVFNRAILARRPVGSTFKPFVYTAAIQSGLFPTTLVEDAPVTIGNWQPNNSDGTFGDPMPLEAGLFRSRNTVTVRAGETAGIDHVVELAERAGLGKVENPTPQLYIGNFDTSLESLTSAYTCFPNGGQRLRPYLIERIENKDGDVIFRNEPAGYPVLTPGASWCVTAMMEKVLGPGGTAASARTLGYKSPAAGKTGTTDEYKDAWFVGFNRRLTCGVWVGMDQPQRIAAQAYGSRMALPVWVDVMKASGSLGYPAESPRPDVPVEPVELCRVSGKRATDACRHARSAVETELPADLLAHFAQDPCPVHRGGGFHAPRTPAGSPGGSGPGLWDRIKGWFR